MIAPTLYIDAPSGISVDVDKVVRAVLSSELIDNIVEVKAEYRLLSDSLLLIVTRKSDNTRAAMEIRRETLLRFINPIAAVQAEAEQLAKMILFLA